MGTIMMCKRLRPTSPTLWSVVVDTQPRRTPRPVPYPYPVELACVRVTPHAPLAVRGAAAPSLPLCVWRGIVGPRGTSSPLALPGPSPPWRLI